MKQIQIERFGPPAQVVKYVDVPGVGDPSAWEVVVDVEAFPINPADLSIIAGRYGALPDLPSPVGMEAVGRIAKLGESVKDLQVGDRVMITANNNWAEQRRVPAAVVQKLPAEGDLKQLALTKVNPATALILLQREPKPKPNEWVVQNAPLSSVGRCVIQIAKSLGIRTINIVRREETVEQVRQLGGDLVFLDGPDIAQRVLSEVKQQPVRMGLDAVAGSATGRLAECVSEGGTVVNYGMLSGEDCQINAAQTIFRGIKLEGFWLSKRLNRLTLKQRTETFDKIASLIAAGTLQFQIDSCFKMHEIGDAIERAELGGRDGKVIVLVNGAG